MTQKSELNGMQSFLLSSLVSLCTICILVLPAAGQVERILLVGGNYRLQAIGHNMQDGFFGAPAADSEDTHIFFDTRLRLSLDFRPHPAILVNYKMEIGDITFGADDPPISDADGRRLPNVGRGAGGEPGSDDVNVETKNFYLDVQAPWVPGLSFRGGIIGWGDQFDWAILATDFTGLQLTYQRQAIWAQLTFLKLIEGSLRNNADDSNWFALDTRWGLAANTALTASVYFWDDNDNNDPLTGRDAHQLYAGLKLNTVLFGKGLLEAAGVYNYGQDFLGRSRRVSPDGSVVRRGLAGSDNQGFMGYVHFDYPLGKHWVGMTLQYISGEEGGRAALDGSGRDVDAFLGLFNSQYSGFGLSRYSEGGGLELITLGQLNDSTAGLNNVAVSPFFGGGYNGRLLGVIRAKFTATPVLFVYLAGGWDQAASANEHGEKSRGIEFNSYVHWDIFPKLWMRVGGAYMLTSDWWQNNRDVPLQGFPDPLGSQTGNSPKDIFQFMLRLQYNFG